MSMAVPFTRILTCVVVVCVTYACLIVSNNIFLTSNVQTKLVDSGLAYSEWSSWEPCSVTCGQSTRTRRRTCKDTRDGDRRCAEQEQVDLCLLPLCPDHEIGFGPWSVWSACSSKCGGGTRTKRRVCSNHRIFTDGKTFCEIGPTVEDELCNTQPCAEKTVPQSSWTVFGTCKLDPKAIVLCGRGNKTRTRYCTECKGQKEEETVPCDIPCREEQLERIRKHEERIQAIQKAQEEAKRRVEEAAKAKQLEAQKRQEELKKQEEQKKLVEQKRQEELKKQEEQKKLEEQKN